MTSSNAARCAVALALVAAVSAGCAGSQGSFVGAQAGPAAKTRAGGKYRVLHSFGSSPIDGTVPQAGLTDVDGTLYGTTLGGGSGCYSSGGCGTVYAITTAGAESVLYSFKGGADGALPYAELTEMGGLLYGTTGGGASSSGTVFSVATSGTESVLYNFKGIPDGANPAAPLIASDGILYGTTPYGGSEKNRGTVFTLAPSGQETVLYNFLGSHGAHRDGKYPESRLLDVSGTLYGTTYEGGKGNRGTVFKIAPSGTETVLHSFKGTKTDGAYPRAGLLYVNGLIYGTTSGGGNGRCEGCGHHEHFGTVFEITPSGKERLIYKFKGYPTDGAVPGELLYKKGVFYGATESGGANCAVSHGCGAIFSITPSGSETMLYSFLPKDGAEPVSRLIELAGTLYGTTPTGGAYGEGTVYAFRL